MKLKIFLIVVLFFPTFLFAQTSGKVIKITDGDTFVIETKDNRQIRVRFFGIDCPEMDQAYGYMAKKFTSDQSLDKTVSLIDKGHDPYHRLVAIVMLNDSTSLNELLLANGWAWHATKYDQNPQWEALADHARADKLGLWQGEHPIPPWVYRRNKR